MSDPVPRSVAGSLHAYGAFQARIASAERMSRVADDAAELRRLLDLRSFLAAREEESRNADDAASWLGKADLHLRKVVQRLHRARELAVRGGSVAGAQERKLIATEVAALRETLLTIANTRHHGQGVFAGLSSNDAVGRVGGRWAYQGDSGRVDRRVGERDIVAVNITGDEVFGFNGVKDVFSVLDDLESALIEPRAGEIESVIVEIETAVDTVFASRSELRARRTRIKVAQIRLLAETERTRAQLAAIEDFDLHEALLELEMRENSYEAAAAALNSSTQPSLLDFLR